LGNFNLNWLLVMHGLKKTQSSSLERYIFDKPFFELFLVYTYLYLLVFHAINLHILKGPIVVILICWILLALLGNAF
jgi:hypothetical protein